jgi:hypothetical protein
MALAGRAEIYFSVDVEADGPIPGPYSMVSFGAAVAGVRDEAFTPWDPSHATFTGNCAPSATTSTQPHSQCPDWNVRHY